MKILTRDETDYETEYVTREDAESTIRDAIQAQRGENTKLRYLLGAMMGWACNRPNRDQMATFVKHWDEANEILSNAEVSDRPS